MAASDAYFHRLSGFRSAGPRRLTMTAKLITVVCVTVLITSLLMVTVLHTL
jgi:hypothetical protein